MAKFKQKIASYKKLPIFKQKIVKNKKSAINPQFSKQGCRTCLALMNLSKN